MVAVFRKSSRIVVSAAALLAAGVLGLMSTQEQLAAQAYGPLLPLPAGSLDLKTSDLARDPEALRRKPEDDGDAGRLAQEIKEMRDDLAHAQGPRALELHEQAMSGYASLAYYLEDVAAGRLGSAADQNKAVSQLAAIRGFLTQHAQYVARNGNAKQKLRALYHLNATLLVSGSSQKAAATALHEVAKAKGDSAISRRAALVAATYDIGHGSNSERDKARSILRSGMSTLGPNGQVTARLILARSEAGLSDNGAHRGPAKADYRNELAQAAHKAQSLGEADQARTLAAVVGIWRAAEGRKIDWSKPPFKMSPYAKTLTVHAIVERSALADWSKGEKPLALRKYQSLASSANGTARRADLDLRILDLRRSEYAESKKTKTYETALLEANRVYLDPGVLGDGHEAQAKTVAAEISRRHHDLVHSELGRVAHGKATDGERRAAIALAQTYVSTLTDAKQIEAVKSKVAAIYAMNHQYKEAVAAYKELAESQGADARGYTALAIRSQTVVATWAEAVPWGGVKNGVAEEREELLHLYQKLADLSGGLPRAGWVAAGQIGLLEANLGQVEAAFALWQAQLKADATGVHAQYAGGLMLAGYQKSQQWAELENLARFCLTQQVRPLFRGKPFPAEPMLGVALLEGGKVALSANAYPVAVAKLKEFVENHPTAKNHDEGFFLLAVAYRGANRFEDSIKTLLAFVDRYPRSGYYRQALLDGSDWSAPMAYEENVMFFANRFMAQFPADQEAPRVRAALTALYLGRGRYAEAIALEQQKAKFAKEPADKWEALSQVMDLEERHGAVERAVNAASALAQDSQAPDEVRGRALALIARSAAAAGKMGIVTRTANELAALNSEGAQESLGAVRLILAEAEAKDVVKRYFNLALTDPYQTLSQRYGAFKRAETAYEGVCAAGKTSACAEAMMKLSQLSLDFMQSIEDIDVQQTLAASEVNKFRSAKQGVMDAATKASQQADNSALAAVNAGLTDPSWTEAVIWQNSGDTNLDRVSGEAGSGYVQWGNVPSAQAADVKGAE